MRPAPGPIPDSMPSYAEAIRNIVFLMDMPRPRLMDYSISELVQTYSDGSPKWLVGSTVWLPAVFGQIDKQTDLDIVFQTQSGLERFATGALDALNSRSNGYVMSVNGNAGKRITHPDGNHIIDAWSLEGDESIMELLLTFPEKYQRCSYFMTWGGSSPSYLTRIVKDRPRFNRLEAARGGGYGRR